MTAIATIHDKFIRAILSDKSIATDYFRTCLPEHLSAILDFSTLTLLPDTYVSKELRKTISDIIYSCHIKGSRRRIKISLLLEHKSKQDKFTLVQLGSYIFSGFQRQIAQEGKVSPIIPILLYHGKERWEYHTLASLFEDVDQEFLPFIPDYEFIFHNLGEISDEQIQILENKFLQASFLALKYSRLKAELIKLIPTILSLVTDAQKNLQNSIIVYTFGVSGLEEDQIITLIEETPVTIKSTVMNTLDIFVEKGRKQQTEKAVRNMIAEGLPTELICKVLEVTPDYVARIREALKSETSSN